MSARPTLLTDLRQALRWAVGAAAASGVFWGGGYLADEPGLTLAAAPRVLRGSAQDRWIGREAARGVAELERFLAKQPHG